MVPGHVTPDLGLWMLSPFLDWVVALEVVRDFRETLYGDTPPVVNVHNVNVTEKAPLAASALIASISNPDNDPITYYAFYDAGGGSGHFTVNGVAQSDGRWFCVPASDLGAVDYVGGLGPGSDTLQIRAFNSTTLHWSNVASLTATTDVPPSVNVENATLDENGQIAVASLITSISNPSHDSITEYAFDDTGHTGHFTVNGVAQPDGQWFYVPASDLSSVDYVGGSSPGSDTLAVQVFDATTSTWSAAGAFGATTVSAFAPQYKGFDYVAFYNGAYENSDSLPTLVTTGANSIEVTLDYGIDAKTSQVVADPNYTDSLTALGDTIAQAESLGLTVMVRPLIDFLNPAESAPYSVGEWRQDYQPTNVAAFFASYQQMIVAEAEVAQANGAQILSIGAELDQLTGPQYLPYWTQIIDAVQAVFTGAITYSASWNTASQVSFWNQLTYVGVDCYVPLSNAANPTLQQLVDGWLDPATEASNPGAYAVIGNQSPMQYFENLAAETGKPLIFTELGYANDTGAAADPSAFGNSPDPALQAELYQAFFQAAEELGASFLDGVYFWEWDPNGSPSNVGPNIDSFSPQNSPAQAVATAAFTALGSPSNPNPDFDAAVAHPAGWSGTDLIDQSTITNNAILSVTTTWLVDVPVLTLQGAGALVMANGTLESAASGDSLVNAGNLIMGTGTIGDGSGNLTLDNVSGIIQASGGTLTIDTGAPVINSSLLEAAPGATLKIDDAVNGAGGSAIVGLGATVEFASAYSGSVTFAAATGVLKLDDPQAFNGQIFNLTGNGNPAASDAIDLTNIQFGAHTTISYSGTASGGTLTVSDGPNETASITLAGDYENSTFTVSNDGNGGTLVIDTPAAAPAAAPSAGASVKTTNDGFIFKPGFALQPASHPPSADDSARSGATLSVTQHEGAEHGLQLLFAESEPGFDHHEDLSSPHVHLALLHADSFIFR